MIELSDLFTAEFVVRDERRLNRQLARTTYMTSFRRNRLLARSTETRVQKILNSKLGTIASVWGMLGSCAILAIAVWRMTNHVGEGFRQPLSMIHYVVMVPWVFFMAYSEGYKGFQKSYSPRVAARAVFLRDNSTAIRAVFAPVFCMGFFDSTKKRKIVIWCLLIGVTLLVILFRLIPQPWRGVLDLGVIVGLSWGMIATLYFYIKYLFGDASDADPEVPETPGV